MRYWVRAAGLVLMVVSVVALVFGQSAGDCLVLALAGLGMSRWLIGSPE